MKRLFLLGLLLTVFMAVSAPAHAYIGPGLGVMLIWYLLGPVAGVISLVALVSYYPLRYLYKKHKKARQAAATPVATPVAEEKNKQTETK